MTKTHDNDGETDLAAKLKKAQEEATLRKELEKMTELAKRTMADLKNLNRHREEERKFLLTMGNAELIKQLLPVLDNLERAEQHIPKGAEEWFKGIKMSIDQMHKVFNDAGLTPMQCEGEAFDPNLHEAMISTPGKKDMVLEELEKGYMLGGRVVRHAKVKVGNGEKE